MRPYLLLLLALIPSTTAFVDCRIACNHCKEKNDPPMVIEIYCAMCEECKARRREKIARSYLSEGKKTSEHAPEEIGDQGEAEIPDDCPTAPPCSDSEEEPEKLYEPSKAPPTPTCPPPPPCEKRKKPRKKTFRTTRRRIVTPRTVPLPPIPAFPSIPPLPSMPPLPPVPPYPPMPPMPPYPYPPPYPGCCMSMCPCPCPGPLCNQALSTLKEASHQPLKHLEVTETTTEYMYVYVGVPKNVLRG